MIDGAVAGVVVAVVVAVNGEKCYCYCCCCYCCSELSFEDDGVGESDYLLTVVVAVVEDVAVAVDGP